MIAFQAADIYESSVPQSGRPVRTAHRRVGDRVPSHRDARFFAQLGNMYSRVWLSSYFGIGLFTL